MPDPQAQMDDVQQLIAQSRTSGKLLKPKDLAAAIRKDSADNPPPAGWTDGDVMRAAAKIRPELGLDKLQLDLSDQPVTQPAPSFLDEALVNPGKEILSGYYEGTSKLYNTLANVPRLVGLKGSGAERWLSDESQYAAKRAAEVAPKTENFMSPVYKGFGQVPAMLDTYAPAMAAGPWAPAAMGGIGALEESDKGFVPAMESGVTSALMGGYLTGVKSVPGAKKLLMAGGPGAMTALIQGIEQGLPAGKILSNMTASGTTMAALVGADPEAAKTAISEIARLRKSNFMPSPTEWRGVKAWQEAIAPLPKSTVKSSAAPPEPTAAPPTSPNAPAEPAAPAAKPLSSRAQEAMKMAEREVSRDPKYKLTTTDIANHLGIDKTSANRVYSELSQAGDKISVRGNLLRSTAAPPAPLAATPKPAAAAPAPPASAAPAGALPVPPAAALVAKEAFSAAPPAETAAPPAPPEAGIVSRLNEKIQSQAGPRAQAGIATPPPVPRETPETPTKAAPPPDVAPVSAERTEPPPAAPAPPETEVIQPTTPPAAAPESAGVAPPAAAPKPGMFSSEGQAAADRVRERFKSMGLGGGSERGSFTLNAPVRPPSMDPSLWADLHTIGRDVLAYTGQNFAAWKDQMVSSLGALVEQHLAPIWDLIAHPASAPTVGAASTPPEVAPSAGTASPPSRQELQIIRDAAHPQWDAMRTPTPPPEAQLPPPPGSTDWDQWYAARQSEGMPQVDIERRMYAALPPGSVPDAPSLGSGTGLQAVRGPIAKPVGNVPYSEMEYPPSQVGRTLPPPAVSVQRQQPRSFTATPPDPTSPTMAGAHQQMMAEPDAAPQAAPQTLESAGFKERQEVFAGTAPNLRLNPKILRRLPSGDQASEVWVKPVADGSIEVQRQGSSGEFTATKHYSDGKSSLPLHGIGDGDLAHYMAGMQHLEMLPRDTQMANRGRTGAGAVVHVTPAPPAPLKGAPTAAEVQAIVANAAKAREAFAQPPAAATAARAAFGEPVRPADKASTPAATPKPSNFEVWDRGDNSWGIITKEGGDVTNVAITKSKGSKFFQVRIGGKLMSLPTSLERAKADALKFAEADAQTRPRGRPPNAKPPEVTITPAPAK